MSTYDFKAQRLFVEAPLHIGARVVPTPAARNYLLNVLRLRADDPILLFNGRDGEWRARIEMTSRKEAALIALEQTRAQSAAGDLDYAFAPLKQARVDYMVQKAAEMGVARLDSRAHAAHSGAARECGAPARQCDRGRRTMWLAERAGDCRSARSFGLAGVAARASGG